MPETPLDRTLERLLAYPPAESMDAAATDRFVIDTMARVRRARWRRRAILAACGGIGAAFGLAGAVQLSEPLARLFSEVLSTTVLMQGALFTAAAAALYLWFMNDDLATGR